MTSSSFVDGPSRATRRNGHQPSFAVIAHARAPAFLVSAVAGFVAILVGAILVGPMNGDIDRPVRRGAVHICARDLDRAQRARFAAGRLYLRRIPQGSIRVRAT